jgi:anti-sigma regulatory factor (Ser/Thr protein kinase)
MRRAMSIRERQALAEESAHPHIVPEGVAHDDAFRDHSSVEVQTVGFREFSPDPACIPEVRRFVQQTLEPIGINSDHIYECRLIADELATNAAHHAGSIYSVAIELTEHFVRIAVRDDATSLPVEQASSPDSTSGRGLTIVSGTASGWGHVSLGLGKETWADVQADEERVGPRRHAPVAVSH